MKIIIGLGNPGKEYENTRHNFGFMFIDYLEKKYSVSKKKEKLNSQIFETTINGGKVVLVKPLTYMNLSGDAVIQIKKWYKVQNEDILIVYDDIDIEFETIRYRDSGSGGTHNGMKNIVQVLKSTGISRLRLGVGKPKYENQLLANYVLEKFSKEELNKITNIFNQAEEKVIDFLDK